MAHCSCCLDRRRLLAALAGAAGTLPLAGCQGAADLGASFVSPEQEAQMGGQAFRQIRKETPRSGNQAYQDQLRRVGGRIVRVSGSDIPVGEWDFVVFQSKEINAFALPGGHVGAFEGLMRLAGSDELLAAVVGHEVGHVTARHVAQRIGTQQLSQLGVVAAAAALALGGYADAQTAQTLLGAGAEYGILLPFSRSQELEADQIGMRLMAQAGYDPAGAVEFWRRMLKAASGGPPAFLSTHPTSEDRIERLEAYLPEARRLYRPPTA